MDIDEEYIKYAGANSVFARQDLGQTAVFNTTEADENMIEDSEEPQPPYKLTISEYDEIAQRLESSLKQLDLLKCAL